MKTVTQQKKWRLLYRLKPTAGALGALCEENFRLVLQLAPEIADMCGRYFSKVPQLPPLMLDVEQEGPFTSRVRVTHIFRLVDENTLLRDPDVTLKLYRDTGQIEVIEIKNQQRLPLQGLYQTPGLQQKWQANLFLGNWLKYCFQKGYSFNASDSEAPDSLPVEPAEIA